MLKDLNREELINEIYTRAYTKNYFHEAFLTDDIDYIVSCLKASLGNYTTLKYKEWDKQTSSTTAFRKYLNYNGQYRHFKVYMREEVVEFIEYYIKDTSWHKDKYISMVKYFVRILHNKTIYNELDSSHLRGDLKRYKKMYLDCRMQANENIKNEKELIYKALSKVIDNVDMTLDDKQIIKYINQGIKWYFGNETHKLPGWYDNTKKKINQINGSLNITNKRVHILNNWYGLNVLFNTEIQELDFFTNSQKEFMINVLDIVRYNRDIIYKKNRKGEWDLSKKQIADILGLTVKAFDKKLKRIKDKSIANGIVVENNFLPSEVINIKFKAINRNEMIDSVYIDEDEREQYLVWRQDEYDRYVQENYI